MLASETARDTGLTPFKFTSPATLCGLSNLRAQQRNRAMTDALHRVCDGERRNPVKCRVLDLFSPTVALVGATPGKFFRDRDPVHFWRHKEAMNNFVAPMVRDVIASVLPGISTPPRLAVELSGSTDGAIRHA